MKINSKKRSEETRTNKAGAVEEIAQTQVLIALGEHLRRWPPLKYGGSRALYQGSKVRPISGVALLE